MNNSTLKPRSFKPVCYPSGVSTDRPLFRLSKLGLPDPTAYHLYFEDFDRAGAVTGDWTKTNNAGTGTAALASGQGGLLKLLTTAGAADDVTLVKSTGGFTFQPDAAGPPHVQAARTWFVTRFQLDDASLPNFVAGLIVDSNTNPLSAVAEGIFFKKAAAAATVDFIATKTSGGAATATASAIATVVAGTWIELAFCYDPYASANTSGTLGAIYYFVNGAPMGSLALSGSPASTINLTPIFQIKNSTGVARYALVDYVLAAQERR